MDASYQDFLRKVGSATVCGAVIGLERQWRQRAAGLRNLYSGRAGFIIVSSV